MSQEETKSGVEYIGPNKVFGLQREDFTTPTGQEVVRVLFENAPPKIMPIAMYKQLATPEPTDYTTLGDKKVAIIKNALVMLLLEYDATSLEIQTILGGLADLISNMFDKAAHVSLGKEIYGDPLLKDWVPGTNFSHYRTILESHAIVDRAMKNEQSKTEKPEQTSTENV